MSNPKLFISYSWTNQDHEAWVVRLATELRESGVDVILDKWDLKEGHDANAFMERMITDQEIKKVILVCDKNYVDKADGRNGGVGTETQIISPEIYASQAQDKFVALVKERDPSGKAYLPVYYRSRIYIDFSDPSTESDNFEKLLRWIYEQPLYKKPGIGAKPSFLAEESQEIALGTSSRHKRAIDAVRNNRDNASALVVDYFSTLSVELERFRISASGAEFDDAIVDSIEKFTPYRNEVIELFLTIALYCNTEATVTAVHRFFEALIPYFYRKEDMGAYHDCDFDNFKFIVHELFLYAVAVFIKYERFEAANFLMESEYYIPGNSHYGRDQMVSFEVFRQHLKSLEHRNQRLALRRLSLRADLLEKRSKGTGLEFRYLMQADFVLYMRDCLDRTDTYWNWWPETLVYVGRLSGAFEIFARSKSKRYFEKVKLLFSVEDKDMFAPLLTLFSEDRRRLPRWEHTSINPAALMEFDAIGSKP